MPDCLNWPNVSDLIARATWAGEHLDLPRRHNLVTSWNMLQLGKITTLYSREQDRLSLNATIEGEATARIWLTQRIVHRLIPALAKLVEPRRDDPAYAEIIAGISQQQAEAKHEAQTPVKTAEPEHEWLVSKIEFQKASRGIVLIFGSAANQKARLAMDAELIRQWLSILRRVYVTAEWQGAEWPAWMAAPAVTAAPPKVLH